MLSQKHLTDKCLLHTHETAKQCRYLRPDSSDYSKYYCVKLKPKDKTLIDDKIDEHLADCKKNGLDPADTGVPLGDNCQGYVVLKHVEQGYDVDSKAP